MIKDYRMGLAPPTHSETYSELLRRSFNLYLKSFWRTLILALAFSIIVFIPRLLSITIGQNVFLAIPWWSPYRLWFIVINLAALLFFAAVIWRIHCVEKKEHDTFLDDFETAVHKIFFIITAFILQCFIVFLVGLPFLGLYAILFHFNLFRPDIFSAILTFFVLLLQISLGIYVEVLFYFYLPLIVIENDGIILSLKQSVHLVLGNVWRTLRFQLTPWLVYLICLMIIKILFNVSVNIYFSPTSPTAFTTFYPTLLQIIIFAVFIPWIASAIVVQLEDLELKKVAIKQKNVK